MMNSLEASVTKLSQNVWWISRKRFSCNEICSYSVQHPKDVGQNSTWIPTLTVIWVQRSSGKSVHGILSMFLVSIDLYKTLTICEKNCWRGMGIYTEICSWSVQDLTDMWKICWTSVVDIRICFWLVCYTQNIWGIW